MCCWNDQGHRVCDQDFGNQDIGPMMFLVPQGIAEEGPMVFF